MNIRTFVVIGPIDPAGKAAFWAHCQTQTTLKYLLSDILCFTLNHIAITLAHPLLMLYFTLNYIGYIGSTPPFHMKTVQMVQLVGQATLWAQCQTQA